MGDATGNGPEVDRAPRARDGKKVSAVAPSAGKAPSVKKGAVTEYYGMAPAPPPRSSVGSIGSEAGLLTPELETGFGFEEDEQAGLIYSNEGDLFPED
jgi:hypothetical protein